MCICIHVYIYIYMYNSNIVCKTTTIGLCAEGSLRQQPCAPSENNNEKNTNHTSKNGKTHHIDIKKRPL